MPDTEKSRRVYAWLGLIIFISVILRLGASLFLGNQVSELPGIADQISYHTLAVRVLEGHGFTFGEAWWPVTAANSPTAHWSYLYTFFLIGVYKIFGINPLAARIIQAIIVGIFSPLIAFQLAKNIRWRNSGVESSRQVMIGLFAAAVTAVYTYFIYYAAALMTEAFFIIAVMAILFLAIRLVSPAGAGHLTINTLLLGLSILAAVLLRQLILLFLPFLFLWMILVAIRRNIVRRTVVVLGAVTLMIVLGILPVTLFNYTQFNRFVLVNTNAGYALFWANHPIHGTQFIPAGEMGEEYQRLIPDDLRRLDEATLDQELLREGIRFILAEPDRYALLSLSRIPEYFRFWPDSRSGLISNVSRLSSFTLFLPFILVGLATPFINHDQVNERRRLVWPAASAQLLYLFIFIYTSIHVLSWALIRYRLIVDAFLLLFAAVAIEAIVRYIRPRVSLRLPGREIQPQMDIYD